MILADAYEAILCDLDGVVWRGETPLDGAAEAVAALRDRHVRVIFLTNNSSRTPREYAMKLMRMKIPTPTSDIVTSGHTVVAELMRLGLRAGDRVHACCADGLMRLIAAERLVPTKETTDVAAVVVGWFPKGTFTDIARAAALARAGVPLIASNDDATYPTEDGVLPGTGALLAAITTAAGVEPTITGKPEKAMFRLGLDRAGVDASRTLVCGDRAATDVVGAKRAGLDAALMLTGVTAERDLAGLETAPDFILDGLEDLVSDLPATRIRKDEDGLVAVDGTTDDVRELARLVCERDGRRVTMSKLEAHERFDGPTWWRLARGLLVEATRGVDEVVATGELAPYLERLGVTTESRIPLVLS